MIVPELERLGAIRHAQMRLEGQMPHPFTLSTTSNQCSRCGREEDYAMHTQRQPRLL